MNRWSSRQMLALALGALLALGMGVSAFQADDMAMNLAPVSVAMNAPGPSSCNGCDSDTQDATAGNCLPTCTSVAQGLIPPEPMPGTPGRAGTFMPYHSELAGRYSSPDPNPPEIFDLD